MDYRTIFDMGRNRAFTTNEELRKKVVEYLEEGRDTKEIFSNGEKFEVPVLTITGLSLFLGFESRQSFYDYEKRGEKEEATKEEKDISYTLKKARTFIEKEYEGQLQRGQATGAIFALKNFGWKDTQTIEGELNDNGKGKMIVEYVEATHSNLDENGDPIKE